MWDTSFQSDSRQDAGQFLGKLSTVGWNVFIPDRKEISMHSIYRSRNAKKAIVNLYYEKLEFLDLAFQMRMVETSFGRTNVILTGCEKASAMVLIHAWNECAPMALEAFCDLLRDFRVYAVDVLGQPNLSDEARPNIHGANYGEWLYEIISLLNLKQVYLVGVSFGAFIGWKALLHDSRRIHKAFFINPMGIIKPRTWSRFFGLQAPLYLFKSWPSTLFSKWYYQAMYTSDNAFAKHWVHSLLGHYNWDLEPIPAVSKAQAQLVQVPIYIVGSALDRLVPGEQLLSRSQQLFPSFTEGLVLKHNKHYPKTVGYQQIISFIKEHR